MRSPQLEAMNSSRGDAGQPDDEQNDDVRQSETAMLDRLGREVEQDADEGMVAAAIGDRAADEGEDR